jgi:hypothetical protein
VKTLAKPCPVRAKPLRKRCNQPPRSGLTGGAEAKVVGNASVAGVLPPPTSLALLFLKKLNMRQGI